MAPGVKGDIRINLDELRTSDRGLRLEDKDKSQKHKLKEMVRKIMKEMIDDDDDNMTDMKGQQKIQQYIKDGGKGDLNLYNTKITSLPQGLTVGGYLDLYNTKITSLPQGLTVGDYLDLYNTKITSLPQDLKVGGDLSLQYTSITSLPQGLTVGGELYLQNTSITSLPQGLTVGGELYLQNTPLSKNNTIEQIKTMALGVKGDIRI